MLTSRPRRSEQRIKVTAIKNFGWTAGLQRNVDKIESNIRELEEKLRHEKQKFAEYDVVLKEREKK